MAEKIDKWANDGIVKIKPKAYITMVKHVLFYGNNALDSSVEVMGICMGKQVGNDMVIHEAVPVSHGGAIEVGFTPSDYAAFAQVDEEFANKGNGLYACGWYHSHPGMKAFFSGVDIKNHLFYQKESTPKGFGLVFDHEYFDEEGDLGRGYKCFRLNDYSKGTSSDFHDVKTELLPPEDLDVFREVMDLIEASQSKKPLIKEIGGLDDDASMWAVEEEEPEKKEEEIKVEKKPIDEVTGGLNEGIEAFTKQFTETFLKSFDDFKNDTTKATQKGSGVMVDVLANMKETVDKGVSRVRKYLEKILAEEISNVGESLDGTFKNMDNDQREFNKKFGEFTKKVNEDLGGIIKGVMGEKLGGIITKIKEAADGATSIGSKTDGFKKNLEEQLVVVTQLKNSLEKDTESIEKTVNEIKNKIGEEAKDKAKNIQDSLSELKDTTKEITELMNALQNKVK